MKTFAPRWSSSRNATRLLVPAVMLAVTATVGACAGDTKDQAPPADMPPGSTVAEIEPVTPTAVTPDSPTTQSAEAATVPDVVGMNHQQAQDTMQAAGFYALREVDASGQGRALVWDRNWVVVSQSPEGGADVPVDAVVTLNSKKEDE